LLLSWKLMQEETKQMKSRRRGENFGKPGLYKPDI
jgi:hypothetical protein